VRRSATALSGWPGSGLFLAARIAPDERWDMTDQRDAEDIAESSENAEPMENADMKDPTDPTDRTDPTDPMDSTDPLDPIDSTDPSDHKDNRDHFDVCISSTATNPILPGREPPHHGRVPIRRPRSPPLRGTRSARA